MPASLTRKRDLNWALKESGPLVSPHAGAEVLEIDRQTMRRIIDEGILPTVSIGNGRVRIPRVALLRYLGLNVKDEDVA